VGTAPGAVCALGIIHCPPDDVTALHRKLCQGFWTGFGIDGLEAGQPRDRRSIPGRNKFHRPASLLFSGYRVKAARA
jgi:hypothetical protein